MLEPSWVGRRITVRRVLRHSPDAPRLGDVVGDLVALDAEQAVVESRSGLVEIALGDIAAAKLAPPSTRDELDLEEVAAKGWAAAETEWLDGWLLRADHGFTRRANTVLPVRQLRRSLDDALRDAHDWYAQRGLPLAFSVPVEGRRLLDGALAERGWETGGDNHVMVRRLEAAVRHDPRVTIAAHADDAWFARYREGAGAEPAARALITRHDGPVGFARLVDGDRTVAIGRGVVDDGWLGVAAVEVAPDVRRRGLAQAVMTALSAWGVAHGARRGYLQVSADNTAAVALYRRLGWWVHHDYRFRTEPSESRQP
ncbi:MAG TPA: GNAT family N-acetyltransferase [Jatrophihabitantaceae bacterium]|nr:GNAT family N-acetyltransferase [Jatrophihabitantaceae bacterium]